MIEIKEPYRVVVQMYNDYHDHEIGVNECTDILKINGNNHNMIIRVVYKGRVIDYLGCQYVFYYKN